MDTKIAINSTNDDIETLISILAIDDLTVYVLDIEMRGYGEQDIVLYKLIKSDEYKDLKDQVDKESAERVAREYLKF